MKGRSASFRLPINLIECKCGCGRIKSDRDSAGRKASPYITGHREVPKNPKQPNYYRRFVAGQRPK